MNKKIFYIILFFILIFSSVFYYFDANFNDLDAIKKRGVLLVGTTGDYYPMSFYDTKTNSYIGFDISLAEDLAKSLDIKIQFVPTSWPTLMKDVTDKNFDIALSGISITDKRKKQALMSDGYLENGKTILCRKEDADKYTDLNSVNNSKVRVIENPGGTNEKFAREYLPKSKLIIHDNNSEIPELVSLGKADVMITEIIEANYYSHINKNLAAPLIEKPFTKGQIGMLLPKENKHLLKYANKFINQEKNNGRINELKEKYIYR